MINIAPLRSESQSCPEAQKFLAEFYIEKQAETTRDKISALDAELGGQSNFYAFGGEVTDDIRLSCLEYEYLVECGVVVNNDLF